MRKIKFRLIKNGKVVGYMALMPICCKGKRLIWKYSENGKDGWSGAGNAVIDFDATEQYTGLKDKNGTEIYEGDVVKVPALTLPDGEGGFVKDEDEQIVEYAITVNGCYYEILYAGFRLTIGDVGDDRDDGICEVIGTIHDNHKSGDGKDVENIRSNISS